MKVIHCITHKNCIYVYNQKRKKILGNKEILGKIVDAESLRPHRKFQVNIKIQLHAARVSRLFFRFL